MTQIVVIETPSSHWSSVQKRLTQVHCSSHRDIHQAVIEAASKRGTMLGVMSIRYMWVRREGHLERRMYSDWSCSIAYNLSRRAFPPPKLTATIYSQFLTHWALAQQSILCVSTSGQQSIPTKLTVQYIWAQHVGKTWNHHSIWIQIWSWIRTTGNRCRKSSPNEGHESQSINFARAATVRVAIKDAADYAANRKRETGVDNRVHHKSRLLEDTCYIYPKLPIGL